MLVKKIPFYIEFDSKWPPRFVISDNKPNSDVHQKFKYCHVNKLAHSYRFRKPKSKGIKSQWINTYVCKPSVGQDRISAMVLNLAQEINNFVYLLNAIWHRHYVIPDFEFLIGKFMVTIYQRTYWSKYLHTLKYFVWFSADHNGAEDTFKTESHALKNLFALTEVHRYIYTISQVNICSMYDICRCMTYVHGAVGTQVYKYLYT